MNKERARTLLAVERTRVEELMKVTAAAGQDDRSGANEPGDLTDPAEDLTAEQADDAVLSSLQERLAAIERAEHRLDDGTYGYSIRSGAPISDARLEADPAAELTSEEAQQL
jgi:DnaK suppressor protein